VREGVLLAAGFDAKRLSIIGDPIPLAEQVQHYLNTGSAAFSASDDGVLAYQAGATQAVSRLMWFGRDGRALGTVPFLGESEDPRLTPRGDIVAVNAQDRTTGAMNIWLYDFSKGAARGSRLRPLSTTTPAGHRTAVESSSTRIDAVLPTSTGRRSAARAAKNSCFIPTSRSNPRTGRQTEGSSSSSGSIRRRSGICGCCPLLPIASRCHSSRPLRTRWEDSSRPTVAGWRTPRTNPAVGKSTWPHFLVPAGSGRFPAAAVLSRVGGATARNCSI
jgi:hypothetical protein